MKAFIRYSCNYRGRIDEMATIILALCVVLAIAFVIYGIPKYTPKRWTKKIQKILLVGIIGLIVVTAIQLEKSTSQPEEVKTSQEKKRKQKVSSGKWQQSNPIAGKAGIKWKSEEAQNLISQVKKNKITTPPKVPKNKRFVVVNENVPLFTEENLKFEQAYANYGELDYLQRVTGAEGILGVELMPTDVREAIDSITPTGWQQIRYVNVKGGWLYNRSHLIGYQLTGENANNKNLMTGTRWFNTEGMLPFENYVVHYMKSTGNHVRYRVTPVFEGNNQLASGIYMEALSIEDGGELQFHIFIPNRQPGVKINYSTGKSVGPQGPIQDGELSKFSK